MAPGLRIIRFLRVYLAMSFEGKRHRGIRSKTLQGGYHQFSQRLEQLLG